MTVKELIERLKDFDPNTTIVAVNEFGYAMKPAVYTLKATKRHNVIDVKNREEGEEIKVLVVGA